MRRLSRVRLTPLSFNTLPHAVCGHLLCARLVWEHSGSPGWGKEGEFCGSDVRDTLPLCAEKELSLPTSVRRCCEPCRRPREKATALLRSQGGRAPWRASSGHAQPSVEVGAILCFSFLQDAEYCILQ